MCRNISENPCDNEWQAMAANRTRRGSGCPNAHCRTVHSDGRNLMRTAQPELVLEFHPTKNGDVTPDNVKAELIESCIGYVGPALMNGPLWGLKESEVQVVLPARIKQFT